MKEVYKVSSIDIGGDNGKLQGSAWSGTGPFSPPQADKN